MLIPAHGYIALFQLDNGKKTYRPVHAWNEDGHPMYVTERGLKDATTTPNFIGIREWSDENEGWGSKATDQNFGYKWDLISRHW